MKHSARNGDIRLFCMSGIECVSLFGCSIYFPSVSSLLFFKFVIHPNYIYIYISLFLFDPKQSILWNQTVVTCCYKLSQVITVYNHKLFYKLINHQPRSGSEMDFSKQIHFTQRLTCSHCTPQKGESLSASLLWS